MTNLQHPGTLALQLYEAGRLEEASAAALQALRAEPRNPDALHVLGLVAIRKERLKPAVEHLELAAGASPGNAAIVNSLGVAYRILGRHPEATACFRRALALDAGFAEAHSNLALSLRLEGNLEEAEKHGLRALVSRPDYAQAHNILGGIYFDLRRHTESIASFERALALLPAFHEARLGLAYVLRSQGRLQDALRLLFAALVAEPRQPQLRRALSDALNGVPLGTAGDAERVVLASLCADDSISPVYLIHSVLSLVKSAPAFSKLLDAVRRGEAFPGALRPEIESFTNDLLLTTMLPRTALEDAEVELVLTSLRRCILLEGGTQGGISDAFQCALAQHSFISEYAHYVAQDESDALAKLEAELAPRMAVKYFDPAGVEAGLRCLALYRSLNKLPFAEKLLAAPLTAWSEAFRPILRQQIVNRRREAELTKNIAPLTPISDEISRAVRSQYEDNPYPLWVAASAPDPGNIEDLMRRLGVQPPHQPIPRPVPVLVAGCGTGHHPMQVARAYRDCDILAVDLSLSSLAYAARMTEQLGVSNIKFAQADILGLGSIGRQFVLIECGGVLHHMRDPVQGWQILLDLLAPGGLMKIGLYSDLARQSIHAARRFVQERGFKPVPEDIRNCRREIISLPPGNPARGAAGYGDFYTLNSCRDLIMHVQEQVFTLPRIAQILEQLGMRFLGFDCALATLVQFDTMFGAGADRTDLQLWDRFENANPHSFRNMYQFWCCRK